MKVELPKGIKAIHGRMGNWVFRSYKQADGSYKVIAAWQPRKVKGRPAAYRTRQAATGER